jgi:hypothetical protein
MYPAASWPGRSPGSAERSVGDLLIAPLVVFACAPAICGVNMVAFSRPVSLWQKDR